MKKQLYFLLFVLFLSLSYSSYAGEKIQVQEKPLKEEDGEKKDSIEATQFATEAIELLVRERMQRYQDSIEQVTLQLQIDHTAEAGARRKLEEKLNQKRKDDSLRLENLKEQIQSSKKGAIGYPTVIAGDTVRWFYTTLGALTPSERARVTTEKIKVASGIFMPAYDTLSFAEEGMAIEVMLKDRVLTTVTQSDAIWDERDQREMAREIAATIVEAMTKHKEMTSIKSVIKQVSLSLLVVVVCVLLIRLILLVYRRKVTRFMREKVGIWFKGWSIRDYEFMNADQQVRFVLSMIKILRLILSITVVLISLPLLFSIFPMTQRLAGTLFDWVLTPVKNIFWAIVGYLPDLFVVIIIWVVIRYVVKGLRFIMSEIQAGKLKISGFHKDWANSTYNIVRVILYAFGFVVAFPYLPGSESDVFKGVSVFIGIIISLGSSSMISNVIGGLVITYMRPFKVGDHIKIGEITGDVIEKTAFVTRLRTSKQEIITIPNSNILATSVVNYSITAEEGQGVIYHTTISFGYDIPWRDVEKYLLEAAHRCEFTLKYPSPFVLQLSLNDFYASYQLCIYTRHANREATIYSLLHAYIQDVCNENGVELTSPHFRAVRDGNESTIPEVYRKKEHEKDSSPTENKGEGKDGTIK